jgi:Ca2+-binding EF-hand superfamily protein
MEMLKRLDRNGNNSLDPDEMEGGARFMIERVARENPNIRTDRPIPLETLRRVMEQRMGSSSSSSSNSNSNSNASSNSGGGGSRTPEAPIESLVPGFDGKIAYDPIPGFGAAAEAFANLKITDADRRDAENRLREADRNKDGYLTKEESSRYMEYDMNRDGKISLAELSLRYARRRDTAAADQKKREAPRRDQKKEPPKVVELPKSYKLSSNLSLPEGLPEWFYAKDGNKDGQVEMHEFTTQWDDLQFANFSRYDLNADGVILPAEAKSEGRGSDAGSVLSSAPPVAVSAEVSERNKKFASMILKRYDKNGNQFIDGDEFNSSLTDLRPADGNADGKVDLDEYARWLDKKNNK